MPFVIHVSTVIEHQGKIALIQEAKDIARGKWNLPGGHLEIGEKLLDGAIRETYEETGLAPHIDRFLGVYTGLRDKHTFRFVFCGASDTSVICPVAKEEIMGADWFSPEAILAMDDNSLRGPLHLRVIIQDYISGKFLPLRAVQEFL